jgi:hypothetical protein
MACQAIPCLSAVFYNEIKVHWQIYSTLLGNPVLFLDPDCSCSNGFCVSKNHEVWEYRARISYICDKPQLCNFRNIIRNRIYHMVRLLHSANLEQYRSTPGLCQPRPEAASERYWDPVTEQYYECHQPSNRQ